jgi:NAD(P)H-dependent FMN reductase
MKIIILSSSLNKKSRSLLLSEYAQKIILDQNIDCTLIDLKKYELPFCGEDNANDHENSIHIKNEIESSDAILISGPIYNYGVNAVLKNILDLTSKAWEDKPVGFMCMAGGQASYMSIMGFANSLMLNCRCLIIPRFVYALPNSFDEETRNITDNSIKQRIEQLCEKTIQLGKTLSKG